MSGGELNYHFLEIFNTIISIFGAILCLISFLIFLSPKFNENFFIHIRVELFFSFINLSISSLALIYTLHPSTFIGCFYYKYFVAYGKAVCETIALYSNVFTDIRFYFFIRGKKRAISSLAYKKYIGIILTVVLIVISPCIFSFSLYQNQIVRISENNTNEYAWKIEKSYNVSNIIYAELAAIVFRDGLGLIILLAFNIVLLIQVRHKIDYKKDKDEHIYS